MYIVTYDISCAISRQREALATRAALRSQDGVEKLLVSKTIVRLAGVQSQSPTRAPAADSVNL